MEIIIEKDLLRTGQSDSVVVWIGNKVYVETLGWVTHIDTNFNYTKVLE